MKKIIKLEYDENKYVEVELEQSYGSDGGLGGLGSIIEIGKNVFERSIFTLVSFLNTTANKIKDGFNSPNISEVSITVGASLSAEGNLIITSSTSEVNLAITVTFKGEG